MPKRTDLKSTLILGNGPIVIGQAAEFDYSGMHAVRAPARDLAHATFPSRYHSCNNPGVAINCWYRCLCSVVRRSISVRERLRPTVSIWYEQFNDLHKSRFETF
jgi:hypothetical protein